MTSDTTTQQMETSSQRLAARILASLPFLSFRRGPRDSALEDVKRIALVSPHLLKDLGFSYDPLTSNPITATWRKDNIVVWVQRRESHVAVRREI